MSIFASFTAILAKVRIENVNYNLATAIRKIVVSLKNRLCHLANKSFKNDR
jgi:uncharacterized membrane protein